MPIFLDGKQYENEAILEAAFNPVIPESLKRIYITKDETVINPDKSEGLGTADQNEVTPNAVRRGQELDNAELDPTTGLGLEIGFKTPLGSPTEPAGAFNSLPGTQVAPQENSSPEPSNEVDWSKMNQSFGSVKSTSPEDTPVVAQTKSGIRITEGDIDRAINVGMGAGPGTFHGVKAQGIDKSRLYLAAQAEQQGFSREEIFNSTGWFKGADDLWRQEIDDSVAKFKDIYLKSRDQGPFKAKLGTIFEHDDLYQAYPQLKDVDVIVGSTRIPSNSAAFDAELNKLYLGIDVAKDKATLLHEVQHAIQTYEGFAKGGSPGRAGKDFKLKYESEIQKLRPELIELSNKKSSGDVLSSKEEARLDYLTEVFHKYVDYSSAGNVKAFENYRALAGEVESVNVENRVLLTKAERERMYPWDSEDVKRADQYVRFKPTLTTPYKHSSGDGYASYKVDPIHLRTPETARFRLNQLLRDKAASKKAGDDVEGSDYMFYNTQIRELREYLKNSSK